MSRFIGSTLAVELSRHSVSFPTDTSVRCCCGVWDALLYEDVDWRPGFWEHVAEAIVVLMLDNGYSYTGND